MNTTPDYDADDRRKDRWIDRQSSTMSYGQSIQQSVIHGQAIRLKRILSEIKEVEESCDNQTVKNFLKGGQSALGFAVQTMVDKEE